jgi:16S rRNA (cytosine1402-N4)-methyltransferase
VTARHEPVLLDEALGFLLTGPGLYLDATLGDGGHAEAILEREPGARLWGNDADPEAIARASARLRPFGGRCVITQGRFAELHSAWSRFGHEPLAGALLDLGVSSPQLDDPTRGMAFRHDAPLDLRLDPTRDEPAHARLASMDPAVLERVLREHGDVAGARRLAGAIVAAAREGRLPTTHALSTLIDRVLGGRPHPRRTAQVFQALRIWINDEGSDLDAALDWLPSAVRPGGVVVTLAYHSGEDRRIKRTLRQSTAVSKRHPEPVDRAASPWEELTRKVWRSSEAERRANPRSRSARLRAFRRMSHA